MRCSICGRHISRCAVPGVQIGPVCAARRGILPEPEPRAAAATSIRRGRIARATSAETQMDWINLINTGWAGETSVA